MLELTIDDTYGEYTSEENEKSIPGGLCIDCSDSMLDFLKRKCLFRLLSKSYYTDEQE